MDERTPLLPRHLKPSLEAALADTPVVCLLGPRQCGKSTLARAFEPAMAYFTLDDETLRSTAAADPAGFVAALPPRAIIDEVQRAPALFRAIKAAVDRDRRPGRFLLTGSANILLLPQAGESLAGRMEILHLQPLTEAEKERGDGRFLQQLLKGGLRRALRSPAAQSAAGLPARLVAGGYPEPLARNPERARQWHRNYLAALIERDVRDVARIRDADQVARLLELLALRNAGLLNVSSLGNELDLRRETVDHYLAVLQRVFLVRLLPAWHRNDAKRLVKTPKVHLVDSGLAATLAGLTAGDWLERRERLGHLLEAFVVQQVIAQAGWTAPDLRFWHYRDKDQTEVDLVVTQGRKTWGIEVKASASVEVSDGRGLRKLAEQAGRDFQGGVLLYNGESTVALADDRLLAVPLSQLWSL